MFRRLLLLLLIALLPLQGVAASFAVKCAAMTHDLSVPSADSPMSDSMPCHEHHDDGAPASGLPDQGCCHHFAVAIPPLFAAPAAMPVHGQRYPDIAASFSDHLPDRLQRPPLNLAI